MAVEPEPTHQGVYAGPASPSSFSLDEFVQISQERTRIIIAGGLVLLLGWIVVASFWYVRWHFGPATERDDLLKLIFTPLIGLLSAVTGFYFGERKGP